MKKKISGNSLGFLSKIKNIMTTRRTLLNAAFVVFGLASGAIFWHQTSSAQGNEQSTKKINEKQAENVWQTAEKSAVANRAEGLPDDFQTLRLDKQRLTSLLSDAPHESQTPLKDSELILQFPMPDGTFSRFSVQEAPVLEEGLQARFPEIKSYRVLGIDRTATTGRFDFTPNGLHATIISPGETISILPADAGDDSLYAVYSNAARLHVHEDGLICSVKHEQGADAPDKRTDAPANLPEVARGDIRKTYRIAFSTTYEYSQAFGCTGTNCTPTTGGVVTSINTWLNGLNALYERELTVKFVMVNNTNAIFLAADDPYDDRNSDDNYRSPIMLNEVRNQLRDKVGEANYDIGHLLTKNTIGGVAGLNAVCSTDTVGSPINDQGFRPTVGHRKGGGYSVLGLPVGNQGSLALFAHEVGHQFGANHSHNATRGREQSNTQYEPGSGNTIMSYFGITPGDNLVGIQDLRFHGISYDQMTAWISTPVGGACGRTNNTGNAPPTVSAGANYTIPKFTPFTLTATGSDPNPDDQSNVTYAWEQFQAAGNATTYEQNGTAASYTDAGDPATTTRPIFRATPATRGTSRTFPSLEYILNNQNDPPDLVNGLRPGEELPRVERILNFRVTARDNVGGVNNSAMTIAVKGDAGPFTVNDPTGTWTGGTTQTVTWNVANTDAGTAVNTANVRISLSIDGGLSFPTTLAHSTPNDGSQGVFVPNNIVTSAARIKVEAIDNIFFDVSGANFTIAPSGACPILTDFSPKVGIVGSSVVITGKNFIGANSVTINNQAATFAVNSDTQITVTVPTGATGGKIAVNKNTCSSAQSTEDFVVCSGSTATLQVGDGTEDNIFGQGAKYFVNRLKPASYPATLSSVTIKYPGYANFPASVPVTILAGKTANGNVNNTSFRRKAGNGIVARSGETITYAVDPVTVQTGEEFVVGFYIADTAAFFPAARDNSDVPERRSYFSFNGTDFTVEPTGNDPQGNPRGGNYLITAAAFSGACTSTRCSAAISVDDGTIESTGTPGTTGTQYYVNRLTPSSYPATITGVRLQTPLPANTAINLLTAASPNGVTNIDNTAFRTKAANVVAPNTFDVYTVAPVTIYSGDFLVGYSVVRNAGAAAVSLDTTPLIQSRSYYNSNAAGTTFTLDGGVNYPIRAVLFSNNCSVGNCTYSYTTSADSPFSAEGGEAVVNIITQAGCPWQLSRRNDWLTVFLSSGTGNGTVVFNVAENNFAVLRTGSLVVGAPGGGNLLNLLNGGDMPETEDVLEILVTQEGAAPTAASVPISGRVIDPNGRGVRNARVVLTDQDGSAKTVVTNPFGYYRFEDVSAGQTVIIKVSSKRYAFAPQLVNVLEEITDLNFAAQ